VVRSANELVGIDADALGRLVARIAKRSVICNDFDLVT